MYGTHCRKRIGTMRRRWHEEEGVPFDSGKLSLWGIEECLSDLPGSERHMDGGDTGDCMADGTRRQRTPTVGPADPRIVV